MRRTESAAITLKSTGLLWLVWLLGWPQTAPGQVTLQVTGIYPAASNVLQVSVTFSNTASRSLNLLDAVDGHPSYIIEPDPKLGLRYYPLTRLSNSMKLNLAPRASLPDNFYLTNPPPRFRLVVGIRDLAAEKARDSGMMSNLVSSPLGKALLDLDVVEPPKPLDGSRLPPAKSVWLESRLPDVALPPTNQTNRLPRPGK